MVDATEKGDKAIIVTQYRPTGKVTKACQAAVNRGVKLVFYHTPATMLGIIGKIKNLITSTPPFGRPDQGWMRGYRNPQNCQKQMHQHAKFILAKG